MEVVGHPDGNGKVSIVIGCEMSFPIMGKDHVWLWQGLSSLWSLFCLVFYVPWHDPVLLMQVAANCNRWKFSTLKKLRHVLCAVGCCDELIQVHNFIWLLPLCLKFFIQFLSNSVLPVLLGKVFECYICADRYPRLFLQRIEMMGSPVPWQKYVCWQKWEVSSSRSVWGEKKSQCSLYWKGWGKVLVAVWAFNDSLVFPVFPLTGSLWGK